jgi:hypothetical protein
MFESPHPHPLPLERLARAIAAGSIDTYEAAVRAVTDVERTVGRSAGYEPLGVAASRLADATRDTAAIQLSAIRWILDL